MHKKYLELSKTLALLSIKKLHKKALKYKDKGKINKAILCYEIWLERELISPSDDALVFLGEAMLIDSDLRRDYSYLLKENKRYNELFVFYKKMIKKVPYHWTEVTGTARTINKSDKEEAILFTEKALNICPKDTTHFSDLEAILANHKNPKPKEKKFIDTIDRHKEFSFIQFSAGQHYVQEEFVKHNKDSLMYAPHIHDYKRIEIPIGISRIGGPLVDLPDSIDYPEDMVFVAQLDLEKFSAHDKSSLLPKTGQLYFFWNSKYQKNSNGYYNHVFYMDVKKDSLQRVTKEHIDSFYSGVLIDQVFSSSETLAQRYTEDDEDDIAEYIDDGDTEYLYNGKAWNEADAEQVSKMFGIYTHCQYDPNDIAKIAYSEKVLLLQIGGGFEYDDQDEIIKTGFIEEGVLLVLISKEDLKNRNFKNCEFEWAKT